MDYYKIKNSLMNEYENDPNNDLIASQLASVEIETRNYKNALRLLQKSVKNNQSVITLNNLAYFYIHIGEPQKEKWTYQVDKAIKLLEKAISLNPSSHFPYSLLGEAYLKKGVFDIAINRLERGICIKSTSANQNNLGVALYKLNREDDAVNHFLKAHNLRNKQNYTFYPYLSYGICLAKSGHFERANKLVRKLTEIYNTDSSGEIDIIDIAKILYLCGNYSKVVELLSEAFEGFIMLPSDFSMYSYSLFKLGKGSEVKKIFQKIIKENEDNIIEIDCNNEVSEDSKKAAISSLTKRIKQFNIIYDEIKRGCIPLFEYEPYIETECYFFGCIVHSESVNTFV